ncbi:MAG: transglycosylase SLT domain-containing protein [Thermodesulfobacteriota bacterium]
MKTLLVYALYFTALVFGISTSTSFADVFYHKMSDGKHIYTNQKPAGKGFQKFYTSTPPKITEEITSFNYGSSFYSENFDDLINLYSEKYSIDPLLVKAIIKVESNFNPNAVSPKGAAGLMQLMPETAKNHGVYNSYNVNQNISGGTKYFSKLMDMFDSDLKLALAGYNAGENSVIKYGYNIPPYKETQEYVKKVLQHYTNLKSENDKNIKPEVKTASAEKKDVTEKSKNFFYRETLEEADTQLEPHPVEKITPKESRVIVESVDYEEQNSFEKNSYSIQVASFKEFDEALKMKEQLDAGNEEVYIEKTNLEGKGSWFRVKVGQFPDKNNALLFAEKLKNNNPDFKTAYVTN